jgi:Putative transposase of IS4/5 family (DUF4096)
VAIPGRSFPNWLKPPDSRCATSRLDQYEVIRPLLPVQRGNVRIANLDVINAVLYVAENGCKWRALPARFGNWHTIYRR